MQLGEGALSIVAIAAAVVAVLALGLAVTLARRVAAMRVALARRPNISDPSGSLDAGEVVEALSRSIQHLGLVRFDAFDDMGGKLSFAAALLDADGNGLVLSSINGRTETRIYAKPIEHGSSRITLSAEEEEAIRRALSGTGDASATRIAR